MLLHRIRAACLIGLPLLLLSASVIYFTLAWGDWAEPLYIISLTANIGYFTNYIAIKMLFKPYQRSVLGRQGLIPKNQPKLAKALSTTINRHFLAGEHWQEYLQHSQLLPKLISASQSYCEAWIEQPANQQKLVNDLSRLIHNNEATINQALGKLQSQLIQQVSQQLDVNEMLTQGFDWVEQQFEQNPRQMEFLIEPIVKTVAENVPLIAQRLVETIDQHIENQDTFKRGVAKAARWSANITEEDVKQYLFRMVASVEFRQTLLEGLTSLVSDYKNRKVNSNQPDQMVDLTTIVEQFINNKLRLIDSAKLLNQMLDDPDNATKLQQLIANAIAPFFRWLTEQLDQPQVSQMLNQQISHFIETIDLTKIIENKARSFSAEKMQHIFQSMISDQLVFIELLGALLGGLSGLALINLGLFSATSGVVIAYFLLDCWLTNKRQRNQTQQI